MWCSVEELTSIIGQYIRGLVGRLLQTIGQCAGPVRGLHDMGGRKDGQAGESVMCTGPSAKR